MLVVDPAFQRQGIGKALVSDGIQRAHEQGLPIFLSGSPAGEFLYKHLGFEVRETLKLTSAGIAATMMVKEPSNV
jgi:predicted N-acetyltransferase YhbS